MQPRGMQGSEPPCPTPPRCLPAQPCLSPKGRGMEREPPKHSPGTGASVPVPHRAGAMLGDPQELGHPIPVGSPACHQPRPPTVCVAVVACMEMASVA